MLTATNRLNATVSGTGTILYNGDTLRRSPDSSLGPAPSPVLERTLVLPLVRATIPAPLL